jgi:ice-binding like protein/PEP-CTERM motif-containing protein
MKFVRFCLLMFPLFALTAQAQLGSAAMFGVLGATTVTNTGNTVIDGDLGVWPGSSITGFPPGIVNGTIHDDDAVAMQAQLDALTAYNFFQGLSPSENLTGQDLGGLELTPGVYAFDSSAQLTGELMINWEGLSNQTVVFQIGSTLTTASASMVVSVNPGQNDNIYWNIGSSATLGTTTSFQGTVIADQSATLNTGASDTCGRVIALNGAVTLDDNFIDNDNCPAGTTTTTGTTTGTVPEPSSIMLFGSGILGVASFLRRKLS